MAATARFTELDEFLEEIDADGGLVEREIIRATKSYVPHPSGAGVHIVMVEAGYRVGGEIVRLKVRVGELWGTGADEEINQTANELLDKLKAAVAERGLELRGGLYEGG